MRGKIQVFLAQAASVLQSPHVSRFVQMRAPTSNLKHGSSNLEIQIWAVFLIFFRSNLLKVLLQRVKLSRQETPNSVKTKCNEATYIL